MESFPVKVLGRESRCFSSGFGLLQAGQILATPACLGHCADGVHVQEAVEVAEQDHAGEEDQVRWMAGEVRDELHDFREEEPSRERSQTPRTESRRAVSESLAEKVNEAAIYKQRRSLKLTEVDHVGAPCILQGAPVSFVGHDGEVTAPVSASPTKTLVEVCPVRFQASLENHRSLQSDLPAMRVQVASQELVVVRVERTTEPSIMSELVFELLGGQDVSTVSRRTATEGGDATIDGIRRDVVENTTLEVANAKEVPEIGRGIATNALTSTASTNLRVLEDRQELRQVASRPEDIIIRKDNQVGLDLLESLQHLMAFVQLLDSKDVNVVEVVLSNKTQCLGDIGVCGDQEDLFRTVVLDDAVQTLHQFVWSLEGTRNYNRDVFGRGILGIFSHWVWLEGQVGVYSNKKAKVSNREAEEEKHREDSALPDSIVEEAHLCGVSEVFRGGLGCDFGTQSKRSSRDLPIEGLRSASALRCEIVVAWPGNPD